MALEKIADAPKRCTHPEHHPPRHMVLSPGTWRHTCPGCGSKVTFTVPDYYCRAIAIGGDTYTHYFGGGLKSKVTIKPEVQLDG